MKRFVVLPRGINVGTAKRVAMADLRRLLKGLGFANARTLLNSGNAVFDAPSGTPDALAKRIRKALADELGVEAQITVKSVAELDRIVAANPLAKEADRHASRLMAVFVQQRTSLSQLSALAQKDWAPEALAIGDDAAYLWLPEGIIESKLAKALDRAMGDAVTTRNWATVQKLQALAAKD